MTNACYFLVIVVLVDILEIDPYDKKKKLESNEIKIILTHPTEASGSQREVNDDFTLNPVTRFHRTRRRSHIATGQSLGGERAWRISRLQVV